MNQNNGPHFYNIHDKIQDFCHILLWLLSFYKCKSHLLAFFAFLSDKFVLLKTISYNEPVKSPTSKLPLSVDQVKSWPLVRYRYKFATYHSTVTN